MGKQIKSKRLIAVLVCIAFIVVSFLSLLYIVEEINHECTGVECSICANIQEAANTFRQMGCGLLNAISLFLVIVALYQFIFGGINAGQGSTLVALMVRMNN